MNLIEGGDALEAILVSINSTSEEVVNYFKHDLLSREDEFPLIRLPRKL